MIVKMNSMNESYLSDNEYSGFELSSVFESYDSMTAYLQECGILTEGLKEAGGGILKLLENAKNWIVRKVQGLIKWVGELIDNIKEKHKEKMLSKIDSDEYVNFVKNGGLDRTVKVAKISSFANLNKQYESLIRKVKISQRSFDSGINEMIKKAQNQKDFDAQVVFNAFDKHAAEEISGKFEKEDVTVNELCKRLKINAMAPDAPKQFTKRIQELEALENNAKNWSKKELNGIIKVLTSKIDTLKQVVKSGSNTTNKQSITKVSTQITSGLNTWASGFRAHFSLVAKIATNLADMLEKLQQEF